MWGAAGLPIHHERYLGINQDAKTRRLLEISERSCDSEDEQLPHLAPNAGDVVSQQVEDIVLILVRAIVGRGGSGNRSI